MLAFLLTVTPQDQHEKIETIWDDYQRDMFRLVRFRLKKQKNPNYEIDAEDIVQETYLKIIRHLPNIPDRSSPERQKAYVFAILSHTIADFLADRREEESIEPYLETLGGEDDFFRQLEVREQYETVMQAMEQLDEIYKVTFYYRYTENLSVKETADLMGVSPRTIESRIRRGREKILAILHAKEGSR